PGYESYTPSPGTATSITLELPLRDPEDVDYGTPGTDVATNVNFYNRTKATPTVTTKVIDDEGDINSPVVTSITLGESVRDTVTVTGINGFAPTGTVDFFVSDDGGSSWTEFDSDVALTPDTGSATAVSAIYTPDHADTYYFRAEYDPGADPNYLAAGSSDFDEPLTVGKADSTTTTKLIPDDGDINSPVVTSITLGDGVKDTVTVTGLGGSFPMPSNGVEFQVVLPGEDPNNESDWDYFDGENLDGAGQAISDTYTPLTTGQYYFRAVYLGDLNYKSSKSGNTAEPLTVDPRS
ncbi:MAG: hypothetical protein AMK73_05410, partial [Planctomycetes bacterium SM23_32]